MCGLIFLLVTATSSNPMPDGYSFSISNNTRRANPPPGPRHGVRPPGDSLAAAATARPAKKKKIVTYDPDFGDNGDVWRKAEARSVKFTKLPVPVQTSSSYQSRSTTGGDSAPRQDYTGVLDNMGDDTMLNEHGFPLSADDVARISIEQNAESTSQGKVRGAGNVPHVFDS